LIHATIPASEMVVPEPARVAVPETRRDAIADVAVVAPPPATAPEPPAIAEADHEVSPPIDDTTEAVRAPRPRPDTARPRDVEPIPEAPARASTLATERVALEIARTAIGRGAYDNAIDALASHERDHPRSAVAEEREVLWIRALAGAGRGAEASARAAAFRRRYPESLFLAAIEHIGAP
jgi:hypothetical protein